MAVLTQMLLCIEERLNSRHLVLSKAVDNPELELALNRRKLERTAADYVLSLMPVRGFRTAAGEADWVRFYRYARIDPSVWSTFTSGKHAPSKETLLKIVIGLRLGERDAREFMSLAGSGLRSEDFRDRVVLACMDCGYYDVEDVYAILEEYGGANINGKRRFKNIY